MRFKTLFLSAAIAASLGAIPLLGADTASPTTAPSTEPSVMSLPSRRPIGPLRAVLERLRNNGGGAGAPQSVTPEEWARFNDFLKQNAPVRYSVMQDLKLPRTSPIVQEMLRRWRAYESLVGRFPEVAAVHLKRFTADDHLLGLVMDARKDPSQRDDLRPAIAQATRDLAELNIQEEQLRILKLETLIDQQKQQFAYDKQNEETAIKKRTDRIMDTIEQLEASDTSDNSTTRPADAAPSGDTAPSN